MLDSNFLCTLCSRHSFSWLFFLAFSSFFWWTRSLGRRSSRTIRDDVDFNWFAYLFNLPTEILLHIFKLLTKLVAESFMLIDMISAFCGIPTIFRCLYVSSTDSLLPLWDTNFLLLDFLSLRDCFHVSSYHTLCRIVYVSNVLSLVLFLLSSFFDIFYRLT